MLTKNAHCSYCGVRFPEDLVWPRTCAGCANISFLNPLPVALLVLPVDGGVLCVRRGISPSKGLLGLPGGFLDIHETWQQGTARELFEETGIRVAPDKIQLLDVLSAPDQGVLLIFAQAPERTAAELPPFVANEEVTELVILRQPEEMAFPTVTELVKRYFSQPGGLKPRNTDR